MSRFIYRNSEVIQLGFFVLLMILILGVLIFGVSGLKDDAEQAVVSSGYSQVVVGRRAFFKCGHDDWAGWYFQAKNPAGSQVSGVACCGFLKGCTIRF